MVQYGNPVNAVEGPEGNVLNRNGQARASIAPRILVPEHLASGWPSDLEPEVPSIASSNGESR